MKLPKPPVLRDTAIPEDDYFPLYDREFRKLRWFAGSAPGAFCGAAKLFRYAWHNTPSGSLPNDEEFLREISEVGPSWKELRFSILDGWYLAADGRLYHPVLSRVVNSHLRKRRKHSGQTIKQVW